MESCPTQAVLPLVGLAAEKVIRGRLYFRRLDSSGWKATRRKPSSRWSNSRRRKSSEAGIIAFRRASRWARDRQ
ncbi:MAG: hypothetical protein R6U98_07010 [Pirellulaceae bacterium]